MLQKLADHIAGCLERAAAAEHRAAEQSDPALKHDHEQIAKCWRQLAASYQFSERLERFILDVEQAKRQPPSTPEAKTVACPKCGNPMQADRTTPRFGSYPELKTYVCRPCKEAVTVAVLDD